MYYANENRMERALESSGIAIAPPERPRAASATIKPPPTHALPSRLQRADAPILGRDGTAHEYRNKYQHKETEGRQGSGEDNDGRQGSGENNKREQGSEEDNEGGQRS